MVGRWMSEIVKKVFDFELMFEIDAGADAIEYSTHEAYCIESSQTSMGNLRPALRLLKISRLLKSEDLKPRA